MKEEALAAFASLDKAALIAAAKAMQPELSETREHLHRHPEPSRFEAQTAVYIEQRLKEIGGYTLRTGLGNGGHGILADLDGAYPGRTVVLRADMDALQITEETGAAFCSENQGVMHACGHDNHMTIALGAAKLLAKYRDRLHGHVRFIFQPAEELSPNGGSRSMIESGALEGADAVFGLHCWPDLPVGVIGVKPGPAMAASDHIYAKLEGKASHAAKPQDGIDAVVAGAQFVTAVQSIVSRSIDPLQSAVITLGKFNAGTRYNIVAGSCEIEGTCRTLSEEARDIAERRLGEVLAGVGTLSGCKTELNYERGYAPLFNDEAMSELALSVAAELFGDDHAKRIKEATTIAEDFGFYLKETPGAFLWLGTGDGGAGSQPLHNCCYNPSEDILWRGAAEMAALAMSLAS